MDDLFLWIAGGVTGFAAIVAAVRYLWRKAVKPIGRAVRAVVHTADMVDQCRPYWEALPVALPVLADIAEEFKPNGGASLHDRTVRIETTLGEVAILAGNNQQGIARVDGKVDQLARYVAALHDDEED